MSFKKWRKRKVVYFIRWYVRFFGGYKILLFCCFDDNKPDYAKIYRTIIKYRKLGYTVKSILA